MNTRETGNYRIVEYTDDLAAELARMWRESAECWNGFVDNQTEETVRANESTSPHLKLWIALDGDRAVGYCKLQRYAYDADTLYVRLLGAHPAWHGRGIGRDLVKLCVEETIARGVPRLDLFTWAGNTKAIPLYKKCGFFWDLESEYTHLMNFLPGFATSRLGARLLAGMDWYADSTRTIEVVPDWRDEGGHVLYSYAWGRDGRTVRATYEHYGRGLVALETERWSVRLEADPGRTVFGGPYPCSLRIESRESVDVTIEGMEDRGVHPDFSWSGRVSGAMTVAGTYRVDPVESEQDKRRTYPRLAARVTVDGDDIVFALGRRVAFPATLSLSRPRLPFRPGTDPGIVLSAESNLPYRARFDVELGAGDGDISPAGGPLSLELDPGRRASIPVPCAAAGGTFWSPVASVATTPTGTERADAGPRPLGWTRRLSLPVPAPGAASYGRSDTLVSILAGDSHARLDLGEEFNNVFYGAFGFDPAFGLMEPTLGRPYTQEFTSAAPADIRGHAEGSRAALDLVYRSADRGFSFTRSLALAADGTLEHRFGLEPGSAVPPGASLIMDFWMEACEFWIPYDGRILVGGIDDDVPWRSELVDERWMAFRAHDGTLCGVTWDEGSALAITGWKTRFEYDLSALAASGATRTGAVRFHLGTFRDLDALRAYAADSEPRRRTILRGVGAGVMADGRATAFIDTDSAPTLAAPVSHTVGAIELAVRGDLGSAWSATMAPAGDIPEGEANDAKPPAFLPASPGGEPGGAPVELLEFEVKTTSMCHRFRRLAFRTAGDEVELSENDGVLCVSNGIIGFGLDPRFSNGIHSLAFEGREWLHSGWPVRESRSWYTEWTGGITSYPNPLFGLGTIREPREARFVEAADDRGRTWRGVESVVRVEHDEGRRGLTYRQRFLCLPGLPLLRHDVVLDNRRGEPADVQCYTVAYLSPGGFAGVRLFVDPEGDSWMNAGSEEAWDSVFDTRLMRAQAPDRRERLYRYSAPGPDWYRAEANTDPAIFRMDSIRRIHVEDGQAKALSSDWYLFDARDLRQDDFMLLDEEGGGEES